MTDKTLQHYHTHQRHHQILVQYEQASWQSVPQPLSLKALEYRTNSSEHAVHATSSTSTCDAHQLSAEHLSAAAFSDDASNSPPQSLFEPMSNKPMPSLIFG